MLDAISRAGCLQAAAAEMKMSYKAPWARIRALEERTGQPLVVGEGRGSRLTPFAEHLMKQFKRLRLTVLKASDEINESLMSDHPAK